MISNRAFESSDTVIIANSMAFADALSGVPLAYEKEAPILLAHGTKLETTTIVEIKRLGAKEAIILGGDAAISQSIENELRALGLSVQRLSGDNRYQTSAIIADELAKTAPSDKAVVVDGMEFADAMSIAPFAAQEGMPIYLTKTHGLSNAEELNDYSETYIVGGETAVSSAVEDVLNGVKRLAGLDRYETNREVLDYFSFDSEQLFISTGLNFADALTGSVLAAREQSAVALVKGDVHPDLLSSFEMSPMNSFTILGGEAAVSNRVKGTLDGYLAANTDIVQEEFKENFVKYSYKDVNDNTIPVGEEVLDQKGEEGYDLVTFEVTFLNGEEIKREEISQEVIAPVEEIIRVGTMIEVTDVVITTTQSEVLIGDTLTLSAEISPEDATNKALLWTSSDSEIASVDQDGEMTALAEGQVEIIVESEDGGFSDSITIDVLPIEMTSLEIDADETSLYESETTQLKATILPENTTYKNLTWSSSDENIATVDSEGVVSAFNFGKVDITVSNHDNTQSDTVTLEVKKPSVIESQDLNYEITQFDEFYLPDTISVELSNGFSEEVEVNWHEAAVDTSNIGEFMYEGVVDYYAHNVELNLKINEFVPDVVTNAYSSVTINGLSKSLSIQLYNYEYQPLEIKKIEVYERGRIDTTYSAAQLISSGINTTVNAQEQWGMSISYKLGIWVDNSYVKYYVEINGNEYVFTDYL